MSTVQCNLVQPTMLSFGSRVGLSVVSLLARHTGLSQTLSEAGPTTVHMRISTLWKIRGFLTEFSDGKYCGDSYPPGSLGIRDAGWEKGVYCLLSICFC